MNNKMYMTGLTQSRHILLMKIKETSVYSHLQMQRAMQMGNHQIYYNDYGSDSIKVVLDN